MNESVGSIIATVTNKVFEKPIINLPNFDITISDIAIVGVVFGVSYFIFVLLQIIIAVQVKRERIRKAQSRILLQQQK